MTRLYFLWQEKGTQNYTHMGWVLTVHGVSFVSDVSILCVWDWGYMSLIVKRFEGLGWFNYDQAFRRQAAIMKSMNWSRIDSTHSLVWILRARQKKSFNHSTSQCQESQIFWGTECLRLLKGSKHLLYCASTGWGARYGARWPTQATVPTQKQSFNRLICGLYNSREGPAACTRVWGEVQVEPCLLILQRYM
jgi:hypothetical protein